MIPKEMTDMSAPNSCEVRAKLIEALRLDLVPRNVKESDWLQIEVLHQLKSGTKGHLS